MARPYYETLGASETDDQAAIDRHYRARSRECHPDTHPDDPQAAKKFKAVAEAYAVLGDPAARAHYDRTGRAAKSDQQLRAEVLSIMAAVLHSIIRDDMDHLRDSARRPLVDDMAAALDKAILKLDGELVKLERARDTLADVASRFSPRKRGGANDLAPLARSPLPKIEEAIEETRAQLALHKEAWAAVKRHKFNPKSFAGDVIDGLVVV